MAGRRGAWLIDARPGEQANRSSPHEEHGLAVGLVARQYAAHLRIGLAFNTVTA